MEDFFNLILEPLKELFLKFKAFVPNLLAMLVILLVGIIFARIVKLVLVKFLTAIKFDSWSDRMGFTKLMRKGDLWAKPSAILGEIVFWLLIIVTLMTGLNALQIPAVRILQLYAAHLFRRDHPDRRLSAIRVHQPHGADHRREQRFPLRQAARQGGQHTADGADPGDGDGAIADRTQHRACRVLHHLRWDRDRAVDRIRRGRHRCGQADDRKRSIGKTG